ncbi:MAG: energy-coupling factor transporter transmembrane protein EcfT [Rhodospirillales bacterium]|nr:energy-coupling factor transporter transmembrane protein EcfT [Rhodospirillales bacterium]
MRWPPEPLPLRRLNPLSKLAAAFLYIAAATLVFDAAFQLLLLTVVAIALMALERVGPLALLKVLLPFALVGFGYLWANLLFPESAATYAESLAAGTLVRNPAVNAGATLFLRALCFGLISYGFVRSTDPADFVRALMQHARLPAFIGFSVFSALQFLPYLRDDIRQIRLARTMRAPGPAPRWTQLRAVADLAIPLLASTVRKASRAAISMEARGLHHPMARTSLRPSVFAWADGAFLLSSLLLIVLVWLAAVRL